MWLGIDVGGTKIEAARAVGEQVELLPRLSTPHTYESLLVAIRRLVEGVRATGQPVEKVAIGLPGQVDRGRAIWVPNLPFLDGREFRKDACQWTQAEVFLGNDAQLALLGESWRGSAAGCQQVALFSVGTGVGGALLVDGRVLRGVHGSAGSMGWINLDFAETPDPNHGFLERHCSGTALEQLGRLFTPPRSAREIVEAARQGDASSVAIVTELANKLGAGAATIASVFDPELILFSGGLAEAFDVLGDPLRIAFRLHASPSTRSILLVPGVLGAHAGAYGALRAALLDGDIWL